MSSLFAAPNIVEHTTLAANGPLTGVVICCTSVPDETRTKLAAQAEHMGAVHRYDLTLDVTHLIVGSYETEKYRYVARERSDICPMSIDWIGAVRALWIQDLDINVAQLERDYTLPTFKTLRFCMTGCDDPAERLKISEQVRANGATYEGDLTKQITHLISFRTEGAKYKAARTWGIKVVSVEWLWDSLERGMILHEGSYDPTISAHARGKGAWNRMNSSTTSLGKRTREGNMITNDSSKRRLRRTASTKLNGQNDQIWGDIVGNGTILQVNRSGQWEDPEDLRPKTKTSEDGPKHRTVVVQPSNQPLLSRSGILSGCVLHYYGFPDERAQILNDHLTRQDARIASSLEDLVSYTPHDPPSRLFIMVPHDLPFQQHLPLPPTRRTVETVTVWWLERCLHHKRLLEPCEHVIGQPFRRFPIDGFSQLSISTSGFIGIDLLHVTRAIQLIGSIYSEDMTSRTSILVAKSLDQLRRDKYDHAKEWNIPIVSAQWLWDSIEATTRLPFQTYRLRERKRLDSSSTIDPARNPSSILSRGRASSAIPDVLNKPSINPELNSVGFVDQKIAIKQEPTTELHAFMKIEDSSPGAEAETKGFRMVPIESSKNGPLSERDINSPPKTVSTAPAPSNHPATRIQEDYSSAISDLLAKTRAASAQVPHPEIGKSGRRSAGRILGRVTSNMSLASTNHSRANSVDSTTAGAVQQAEPLSYKSICASGHISTNERIEMLMGGGQNAITDIDSQLPATQLEYDDPDSRAAEERAMARMMGDKMERRAAAKIKKTPTVGDISSERDRPKTRRAGREKACL